MKDIFISYKAEEKDEASWVKSVLESNGFSCWMAPADIPGGSSYAAEIPQAIRQCKIFVLVLSAQAQSSPWVSREVDLALNERKIVMPFMLEDCALQDDFNFYLTNVQRYTAYENKAAAMEKMVREIRALLGVQQPLPVEELPVAPVDSEVPTSEEPVGTAAVPTEAEAAPEKALPAYALASNRSDVSEPWYRPDDIAEAPKPVSDTTPKPAPVSRTKKTDILCLLSLCIGGLSVFLCFTILPDIAAIVLAYLGVSRANKLHTSGKVMAIIGFFLGILATVIAFGIFFGVVGVIIDLFFSSVPSFFFIRLLKKKAKRTK